LAHNLVTEDLSEKSLYLSTLKAIYADMASSSDRDNKSILAVDDESAIVDIIKQSLQRQEFKVCTFTDPFKALAHFNSDSKEDYHHIVLSDIRMPGMNGYEFVRKVKESNPKVKIMLLSAFEIQEKEFHNILPDIKIDAFLQKPFSIQQLNNVVEKISADSP
jgi:two-component system OmpR family response regulator